MAAALDGFRGHLAEVPLRIERVDGPELQRLWLAAFTAGFGADTLERQSMSRLADAVGYAPDAPWQRLVGLVEDRPVASSGVMFGGGVAGVYSVTTAPWLRGRGIGAAMTSAAMLRARALGYRVAVLGSAAKAVPLYRRLGYRQVCSVDVYLWDPPEEAATPGPP
jgi:ribosomal protein S18 acetylase RimI-like enzyme